MKKKKILKSVLVKREKRRLKREAKIKFKEWHDKVLTRDNFKCVIDNKPFKMSSLHPHHILSNTSKYKELRFDVANGITLCPFHHKFSPDAAHTNSLFLAWWLSENRPEQLLYLLDKLKEINISEVSKSTVNLVEAN